MTRRGRTGLDSGISGRTVSEHPRFPESRRSAGRGFSIKPRKFWGRAAVVILLVLLAAVPALGAAGAETPPGFRWIRQFGTNPDDKASSVAVDATGVYVAGFVQGPIPGEMSAGSGDAFLRKYDPEGTVVWTRQFGTPSWDAALSVVVDATSVYVAGQTDLTLPGETSAGGGDAFLRKYDPDGTVVWTRQFGTSGQDVAVSVAVHASAVYVAGRTDGTFPGETSAGFYDAFLAEALLAEVAGSPEDKDGLPWLWVSVAAAVTATAVLAALLTQRRRKRKPPPA